jgi:LEA14-like dessication related protein
VNVVRAIMWLLSLIVVVAPIIYAMDNYGWNIQALVMPSYSPPKIDFHMEFSSIRFENRQLFAVFRLSNLGEVKIIFEALNATVYGPDGKALAQAMLDKPVISQPNSTEPLILKASFDEAAFKNLLSYFEDRDHVSVEIRGMVSTRIFGSKVTAPISTSFEVSLADIRRVAEVVA